MAIIDFQNGPGSDSGSGTAPTPTPPKPDPLQASWDDKYNQLNSVYQSELGRSAGSADTPSWLKQTLNAWDFTTPDWQNQIANSPEALAYKAKNATPTTTTGGGSGDWQTFGQAWLRSGGGTVDDLSRFVAANPQYGAQITGSKRDKVTIGGRTFDAVRSAGLGGLGASWDDVTNGGGSDTAPADTTTSYGNSASTELYVNEILSRLQALRQPVNDPFLPVLQTQALQRVQSLQGAPYTAGEDAALVAKYREPLTQARDAELEQNKEIASARGFLSSSGLLDEMNQATGKSYQSAVASGANDLAVQAIAEKNSRAQEALAILSSLVGASQNQRTEQNAQADDLLRVAAMLPDLDERRTRLLLDASADGGATTSSLNSLLSLAQLSQNQSQYNNNNSAADAEAMGQYIAAIVKTLTTQPAK